MESNNTKAGLFVFVAVALLFYMILQVGQGGWFSAGQREVYMDVTSAVGIGIKTPVQIAGVDVGHVQAISLTPQNKARLKIAIRSDVKIPSDSSAVIKQTGILGDTFIEIVPGLQTTNLKEGDVLSDVATMGDFSSVTGQFSLVADDVRAITKQMKKLMAGDDSSFSTSMKNIETITNALVRVSAKNEQNINAIIANMKVLSQNLNSVIARNMGNVDGTLRNINGISGTINRGEGTIGRLIKDEETIEKIHGALDNVNGLVGGVNRFQVDLGARTEYLGGTKNFKNYVELYLKPRPDKYFLVEVVSDPDPSFKTVRENTTVSSGGATSTVETTRRIKNLDGYRLSAQLAKKFQNFTLRGGMIESSGGVGMDYDHGPFGVKFSAFDFKTDFNQKPHLKAWGTAQLTRSFYVMGGVDDFINPTQNLDWFFGGGLKFTDDDIKSLLGLAASASR